MNPLHATGLQPAKAKKVFLTPLTQNLIYLRLLCNILLDPGYKVQYSGKFPNAQLPYSRSVATVGSKTYIAPLCF